ncbi:hypothetical protein LV84_00243 [Algoriphagus ratkowskyi]|uniref:Uncharacterized protein n=1 Tax=Algoriphagus ratkowskyi TaxID=57028 RepID=A0A2W7SEI8_9BACT|nr:hypothetical protein [Algoriphagus ratkowskyi]PZX61255.1 hypothetical protein LV84_00243 [Algoriphagus ratkowskyi]TXD79370.1 hypothetical protein ESW18_03835 [Algoriphagus ratkowskyi]
MADNSENLDLELWLDKDIILRQNKLKTEFWEILAAVGNSIESKTLLQIHPASRGVKLSKGNDLSGFPYQVLDLIRDFDLNEGLNIRILNWFGHGVFVFVLIGKNHAKAPFRNLFEHNWSFDQSTTPWDYPEILLNGASTNSPVHACLEKSSFYQWHKPIHLTGKIELIKAEILDELNKLFFLLS